jgi:hypothetical protein
MSALKPFVRLYSAKGIGVVVPRQTGVMFSNQAGGYSCLQPEIEGVYIPLDDDFNGIEDKLHEYFVGPKHGGGGACNGLDEADADAIDDILHKRPAPCPLRVDRTRLHDSVEAWVHVCLSNEDGLAPLVANFEDDTPAIMTWTNSD